jgi:hypothetical protein
MNMDQNRGIGDYEEPELPSEAMREEFEFWDEEYTLDALTDLTSSQIEARKSQFERRVHELVAEHNPGRLVKEDPFLAKSMGKPGYSPEQWEEARKMIWKEAEKISLRFDRAKGIVGEEEKESRRSWYVDLAEAVIPDPLRFD